MSATQHFFCVVLRDGAKWAVEAEWPDGSIELVEMFSDYFYALNWLTNKATAWLDQRTRARPMAAGDRVTCGTDTLSSGM
jgi:hypothetical protein